MGWLFSHRSRRELITALIQTDDTEHYHHVTLAHALRGNVLWSVVQSTPKDPSKASRTAIHCTLCKVPAEVGATRRWMNRYSLVTTVVQRNT